MLNIIKSDLALEDAQNIWIYSYENWGEAQATGYIHGIQQAFIKLAENPKRGLLLPVLNGQYYRYHFQSHVIVYRFNEIELQIVRILHKRMDVKRHIIQ